jgi:hypothetical protein
MIDGRKSREGMAEGRGSACAEGLRDDSLTRSVEFFKRVGSDERRLGSIFAQPGL